MFSVLPLKWIAVFAPSLLLNCPVSKKLVYRNSGDQNLRNSAAFSLPFDSKIHQVCHRKFRTTSFRIQAPRKTNDREEIFLHTL